MLLIFCPKDEILEGSIIPVYLGSTPYDAVRVESTLGFGRSVLLLVAGHETRI